MAFNNLTIKYFNNFQTIFMLGRYAEMEPFNIKIPIEQTEVTITILPTAENYFKIVYYGGVLGAIYYHQKTKVWKLVAPDDLVVGDLPPYTDDSGQDRVEIELDSVTIVKIGIEIEKSVAFSK